MSKKKWEEEKEKDDDGWVEEEKKMEMVQEEKVQKKQGQRRRKNEKEEQEHLFAEKSHLTKSKLSKQATWNIYLLFMMTLYVRYYILQGEMKTQKTSFAWGHRACKL